MLIALNTPQMYRFYREGSQYVHGSMYAGTSYSKDLGIMRKLGDFTSTVDWILPLRLCWLSLRESTKIILARLAVPQGAMPNWNEVNKLTDATFQELVSYAVKIAADMTAETCVQFGANPIDTPAGLVAF